ncbi:MAG: hypothetical protein AB7T63_10075 [Planctomycetota bacterium]
MRKDLKRRGSPGARARRLAGATWGLGAVAALRRVGVLLLVVVGLALAALPAQAGEATTPDGDVVRWPDGLQGMGRRVLDLVPRIRRQVAARLELPAEGPMAVVELARGVEGASGALGMPAPAWAAGVHRAGHIVLRSDLVDAGAPLRTLETVLRHEWVHLVWWRRAGLRARLLPRWFEEGLAEHIGGGVSLDGGSELEIAAAFDHLLSFGAMTEAWPTLEYEAALAYRQSQSFVTWLGDELGWPLLRELLGHLAEGRVPEGAFETEPPFDAWVEKLTGRKLAYWIVPWHEHVVESSRPWYHLFLRDLWGTLWMALAVVAAIAFWFVRRSRRRQIDALPDEE